MGRVVRHWKGGLEFPSLEGSKEWVEERKRRERKESKSFGWDIYRRIRTTLRGIKQKLGKILRKIPVLVLHVNHPSEQMWSLHQGISIREFPGDFFSLWGKSDQNWRSMKISKFFTWERSDPSSSRSHLDWIIEKDVRVRVQFFYIFPWSRLKVN